MGGDFELNGYGNGAGKLGIGDAVEDTGDSKPVSSGKFLFVFLYVLDYLSLS